MGPFFRLRSAARLAQLRRLPLRLVVLPLALVTEGMHFNSHLDYLIKANQLNRLACCKLLRAV